MRIRGEFGNHDSDRGDRGDRVDSPLAVFSFVHPARFEGRLLGYHFWRPIINAAPPSLPGTSLLIHVLRRRFYFRRRSTRGTFVAGD